MPTPKKEVFQLTPKETEAQECFAKLRDEILNLNDGLEVNEILSIIDDCAPTWAWLTVDEVAAAADASDRLRQCPTHGQQPANAWACPECLRELREGRDADPTALDLLRQALMILPGDSGLLQEVGNYLRKFPPCADCGAMTEAEAERTCLVSSADDDCHGCELWPDDKHQSTADASDRPGCPREMPAAEEVRARLAHHGRHTFAPIPVSERLPGPEDCAPWKDQPNTGQWCWALQRGNRFPSGFIFEWVQIDIDFRNEDVYHQIYMNTFATLRFCWAPWWAFPIPTTQEDSDNG